MGLNSLNRFHLLGLNSLNNEVSIFYDFLGNKRFDKKKRNFYLKLIYLVSNIKVDD